MATILPSGASISIDTEITYADYPTYTYRIDHLTNQLRNMTDMLDAMRQAVEIILQVERYNFVIYSSNFGVSLNELIGNEYGYVTSELKRRINDAFLPDNRILGTSNWIFSPLDENNGLKVDFVVHTVYGDFPDYLEVTGND